jgi:uncharacterized lipoprotein YehR (DUF1307 family)
MDKQMLDITYNIEQCAKLIGLIQAIIMAIADGQVICGPGDDTGEENLKNFIVNFAGPQLKMSVVVEDDKVVMKHVVPDNMDKLFEIVAENKTDKPVIKQIAIPVKNCLYTTTDAELEKVKDLLSVFESK